jgi:hypothetical protein
MPIAPVGADRQNFEANGRVHRWPVIGASQSCQLGRGRLAGAEIS